MPQSVRYELRLPVMFGGRRRETAARLAGVDRVDVQRQRVLALNPGFARFSNLMKDATALRWLA